MTTMVTRLERVAMSDILRGRAPLGWAIDDMGLVHVSCPHEHCEHAVIFGTNDPEQDFHIDDNGVVKPCVQFLREDCQWKAYITLEGW